MYQFVASSLSRNQPRRGVQNGRLINESVTQYWIAHSKVSAMRSDRTSCPRCTHTTVDRRGVPRNVHTATAWQSDWPTLAAWAADGYVRVCPVRNHTRLGATADMSETKVPTRTDAVDQIALRVREEIARRRMSRQAVAVAAGISLSTLEKALSGRRAFTLATLVRLEATLGVGLRATASRSTDPLFPQTSGAAGIAPDEWGSYNRSAVAWLEGPHLTLRPSFGDPKAVYAYRTDITWDDTQSRLTFREAERLDQDFTQFGTVAVPHQSGHIYLITNRHGQHRMIVVSRPTITGEMYGILTTLLAGRGAHLSPVATPIVLKPIAAADHPQFGKITQSHDAYLGYARLLRRTTAEHFAAFLTPG